MALWSKTRDRPSRIGITDCLFEPHLAIYPWLIAHIILILFDDSRSDYARAYDSHGRCFAGKA